MIIIETILALSPLLHIISSEFPIVSFYCLPLQTIIACHYKLLLCIIIAYIWYLKKKVGYDSILHFSVLMVSLSWGPFFSGKENSK